MILVVLQYRYFFYRQQSYVSSSPCFEVHFNDCFCKSPFLYFTLVSRHVQKAVGVGAVSASAPLHFRPVVFIQLVMLL